MEGGGIAERANQELKKCHSLSLGLIGPTVEGLGFRCKGFTFRLKLEDAVTKLHSLHLKRFWQEGLGTSGVETVGLGFSVWGGA